MAYTWSVTTKYEPPLAERPSQCAGIFGIYEPISRRSWINKRTAQMTRGPAESGRFLKGLEDGARFSLDTSCRLQPVVDSRKRCERGLGALSSVNGALVLAGWVPFAFSLSLPRYCSSLLCVAYSLNRMSSRRYIPHSIALFLF